MQGFAGGVQGLGVLGGHFFGLFVAGQAFQVLFRFFDAVFGVLIQRFALFTAKGGIGAVDGSFRGIQGLDGGFALLVLPGKGSGIVHGAADLLLAQVGRPGDGNALLFAGAKVTGAHRHNAVGVNIKGHFDLRHTGPGAFDALEGKVADELIILGELPLTLQHLDFNCALERRGGGKDFGIPGGNGGVAVDQMSRHTAHRLNRKGQRGNVHQQQVLPASSQAFAAKASALHRSTKGHTLVRVQRFGRFQIDHPHDLGLHRRDAGGTTYQQHLIQVVGSQVGIPQGVAHRQGRALHQVGGQLIKLGAGQFRLQMQRAVGANGDERQVDFSMGGSGKLFFGFLGFLPHALHGNGITGQVHLVFGGKVPHQPVSHTSIKVIAAQMVITAGGQHLHNAIPDLDQRNIECTAAQVVHHHFLGLAVIQTIGQGGRSRFVDNALYIQARNAPGILGSLALGIVKISRYGDNGFCHRFTKISFCIRFQLLQDHGADLLRGEALTVNGNALITAHFALNAGNGARCVGDSLAFGRIAHKAFAAFCKSNDRRGGALAFGIGDNGWASAFHHSHAAVGCS